MQIYRARQTACQTAARSILLAVMMLATAGSWASLPAENAAGWSLNKKSGNIRIYTLSQPDSNFKAAKAVAVLDAPINNVMAVMIDPSSCMLWVQGCSESYGLGEGTFHDRYAYSINDMPWPVTDRDYVLHIQTHGEQASGEVTMTMNAVTGKREKVDKLVRITHSETRYRLIPEGNKTRIVWLQHIDPNGSLPSSLVNSLLDDIPIKSLQKLGKVANLPQYRNFQLIYSDNGKLAGVVP